MRSGSLVHDAAADFNDQNPNGVWTYGYGAVGGDFSAAPDFSVGGAFEHRGGGPGSDGWRGFHHNSSDQPQARHTGLIFAPGALVMHPGNSASNLAKLRFAAPADGCYAVDVVWTTNDEQAKKTSTAIFTNAASADGIVHDDTAAEFEEIFAQGLSGYGASASFAETIEMSAGEILSFELGNGGDFYYDDSVQLELTIGEVACEPSTAELIGQWTFEPGSELVDSTGRWGNLNLVGSASVSGGQLHLHGSGTSATGWANAPGYSGDTIREKTLVAWVALDDLGVRAGAPMAIDNLSGDNFDAIVYAERQAYRWMAGSSYFRRTQDVVAQAETAMGAFIQMGISYRDLGGGLVEITICREGVQIGQYTSGNMTQWTGANAEIVFGRRANLGGFSAAGLGAIEGRVEEARIYGDVLSCDELGDLEVWPDSDGDGVPDNEDQCEGFDDKLDADHDGIADGCDLCRGNDSYLDTDGDGVCEDLDVCLGDDESGDFDADKICNAGDNCVSVANQDQADSDEDGTGDACDDGDADGVLDLEDNCPAEPNPDQADSDLDGIGEVCDDDDDNDGVVDVEDNCALLANADQLDSDEDGQGDVCDGDDDGDGVLDTEDLCPGTPMTVEYNDEGCSGAQYVEHSCGESEEYPNSGQYMRCVAQAASAARKEGLLDGKERGGLVRAKAKANK